MVRIVIVGVCLVTAAFTLGQHRVAEHDAQKQSLPQRLEHPDAGVNTVMFAVQTKDREEVQTAEWLEGERQWQEWISSEAKFYEWIEAERAYLERIRQTLDRIAPPGMTVGECTGFAIPDYIIMRESGGNPSAYNPSGAYGCAQTLLSHYSRGQCVGLDPYTIDGQRECVWRLSNGGTNLNPWSATR